MRNQHVKEHELGPRGGDEVLDVLDLSPDAVPVLQPVVQPRPECALHGRERLRVEQAQHRTGYGRVIVDVAGRLRILACRVVPRPQMRIAVPLRP